MKAYEVDFPFPETFWDTIELARERDKLFDKAVKEMSREELILFRLNFEEATILLQSDENLGIISRLNPGFGVSESYLDNLCEWVVEQGKDYFQKALDSSEFMAEATKAEGHTKGLLNKIFEEYEERYDEDIPDSYDVQQMEDAARLRKESL